MPEPTPDADALSPDDEALIDAAVADMARTLRPQARPQLGSQCPAHHPTARLIADLPLAEQLDAMASVMPCDWPSKDVDPGSPIAGLLRQCAHAIRHLVGQRDRAIELVRMFHAGSIDAVGKPYSVSHAGTEVAEFLAEVDASPGYIDPPCSCTGEAPE